MLTTAARAAAYRRQSPGRRELTARQLARIARKEIREAWPTGEWSDVPDDDGALEDAAAEDGWAPAGGWLDGGPEDVRG